MTLLGAYVNLCNTALGAGILGLPYALANAGYVMGIFMLIICAYFSATGLHLLTKCSQRATPKGEIASFYSIARVVDKKLPLVVDAAVGLKCFGVATSYLIVIGDLMPSACDQMGCANHMSEREIWIFLGFAMAAPFSLHQNIDYLKYTSSLCILFILFTSFIIFLYAAADYSDQSTLDPCYNQSLDDDSEPCKGNQSAGITDPEGFAKVFSIFIFAYTCQQNIFPLINEMEMPSQIRLDKVIVSTIFSAFALYLIVGLCGYATYGDNVKSDVILNYPANNLMSTIRIMVSFVVAFSYPLQINPGRRCILTFMDGINDVCFNNSSSNENNGPHVRRNNSDDNNASETDATLNINNNNIIQQKSNDKIEKNRKTTTTSDYSITVTDPTGGYVLGAPIVTYDWQDLKFMIVTIIMLILSLIIALSVDDLGMVLSLIGATGSTLLGFLLPGYLYLKLYSDDTLESIKNNSQLPFNSISSPLQNPLQPNEYCTDDTNNKSLEEGENNNGNNNIVIDIINGYWPQDPEILRYMAGFNLIAGCIIIPVSLTYIFKG